MRKLVSIRINPWFNKIVLLAICSLFMVSCKEETKIKKNKIKYEVINRSPKFADIGMYTSEVKISIPAMHKLEIFQTVYIDSKFSKKYSMRTDCFAIEPDEYIIKSGFYNPNTLVPDAPKKIKLLLQINSPWIDLSKYNYHESHSICTNTTPEIKEGGKRTVSKFVYGSKINNPPITTGIYSNIKLYQEEIKNSIFFMKIDVKVSKITEDEKKKFTKRKDGSFIPWSSSYYLEEEK